MCDICAAGKFTSRAGAGLKRASEVRVASAECFLFITVTCNAVTHALTGVALIFPAV